MGFAWLYKVAVLFATLQDFVGLLFDTVHCFAFLGDLALLLCLPPQLGSVCLAGLLPLLLILAFSFGLLFLALLSLSTLSTHDDLCTSGELVPHIAGTLHKVLILNLFEPTIIKISVLANFRSLLLRINSSLRFSLLNDLTCCQVFDSSHS